MSALLWALVAIEVFIVGCATRRNGHRIAAALNSWVARQHEPVEVEPGVLVCRAHRGRPKPPWPCDAAMLTVNDGYGSSCWCGERFHGFTTRDTAVAALRDHQRQSHA